MGGIVLNGKTGNINFTGAGSITWGNNAPVKYQFGGAASGPWHDTMQANDKYRRDSLDGGTTWGSAYQFKGTDGRNGADGRNGSDASVTYTNIKTALDRASKAALTIVDGTSVDTVDIHANNIYGGNFYAGDGTGGYININGDAFNLYGKWGNDMFHFLKIEYAGPQDYSEPYITFSSPHGAYAYWEFPRAYFNGVFSFHGNFSFNSRPNQHETIDFGDINVHFPGATVNFSAAKSVEWGTHAPRYVLA